MPKKINDQMNFPTNDKGQPVDPYTDEALVPVSKLQYAIKQVPKITPQDIPEKTSDWLSKQKIPHYGIKEMQVLVDGICKEYEQKLQNNTLKQGPIKRAGKIIRVERRSWFNGSGIFIHKDDIPILHSMCVIPTVRVTEDKILTKVDIAGKLNTAASIGRFSQVFQSLEEEFNEKYKKGILETNPIIRRGEIVRMEFSRYENKTSGSYYYSQEQLPLFACLSDLAVAEYSDQWKTRSDVLEGENGRKKFIKQEQRAYLDKLDQEFLEKRREGTLDKDPVIRNGYPIRMEMCSISTKKKTTSTICYHKDDVKKIRAFAGVPMDSLPQTKKWVDRKAVAALLGGRTGKTDAFFQDVESEFNKHERDPQLWDKPIIRNNEFLNVSRRHKREKTAPVVCYHLDDIEKIKRIIRIKDLPSRTTEWLNKKGLAKALEIHPSEHEGFKSLYRLVVAQLNDTGQAVINGHTVQCKYMHSLKPDGTPYKNRTGLYFHESEVNWFKQQLELELPLDPYTNEPLVPVAKLQEALQHISPEKKLRLQKTAPAQKIGDANDAALPDNVRAELEEKSAPKRNK